MIFSVTETLTWKRCRRKWALQSENMLGLQPIRPNVALMLGSLMHESLESWTNQRVSQTDPTLSIAEEQDIVLAQAVSTIGKYKQQYKEAIGAAPSEHELDPLMDAIALGQDMFNNYIKHYGKPIPKGWRLINLEQRTITDIPGTEHWECDECHYIPTQQEINDRIQVDYVSGGAGPWHCTRLVSFGDRCPGEIKQTLHQIRGTLDGLLERAKDGMFYALERKTYAMHPKPENIALEEQMRTYCWILRQMFGDKAGGILYDGMWKRDGSNKKHKPEDLFYRAVFTRTKWDLDECGEQLAAIAMDMGAHVGLATDDPRLYTNRRWEGCYDCGMNKLCAAISRGEDADDIRRLDYTHREDPNLSWIEAETSN
jgi:hypothetical protein